MPAVRGDRYNRNQLPGRKVSISAMPAGDLPMEVYGDGDENMKRIENLECRM